MKTYNEIQLLKNQFPDIGKLVLKYLIVECNRQIISFFNMNWLVPLCYIAPI